MVVFRQILRMSMQQKYSTVIIVVVIVLIMTIINNLFGRINWRKCRFEWAEALSHNTTNGTRRLQRKNIMFLKTHKTGSSTVTNILNRYGIERKLFFALPKGNNSFNWPRSFTPNAMIPLWTEANILCYHARYGKNIRHVFPKRTSSYITILREPVKQYLSTFIFFGMKNVVGIKGKDDMEILDKYLKNVSTMKSAKIDSPARTVARLLRNPMMFDLGLEFRHYQNKVAIQKYIKFLDDEFDLVMIMDYFDESLVLLKRMLNWDIDDIIYFKQNARRKEEIIYNLPPHIQKNILNWNAADNMLFKHFNTTLWERIANEGPGFHDDLKVFRQRKQELHDICVSGYGKIRIYGAKMVLGPILNKNIDEKHRKICSDLVTDELVFMKRHLKMLDEKRKMFEKESSSNKFNVGNDWDNSKDLAYFAES